MKNSKLSILLIVLLLLGCGPDLKEQTVLIKDNALLNKASFAAQSEPLARQDIEHGPKVDKSNDETLHADSRKQIQKQEAPKFDDVEAAAPGTSFDVDVNVENVDIRTFTSMLSDITGVNFLVSEEVNTDVSAFIRGVSWHQVLDSTLKMKTLAKSIDEGAGIIRIHDYDTLKRIEEYERTRQENMQRALMIKQAAEPLYTEIFRLFYTKPSVVRDMLDSILNGINGDARPTIDGLRNTRPEIIIDERKNLLIVKARKEDLELVDKVIKEIDTRTEQVLIEAFVVEVSDDYREEFGTQFGLNAEGDFTVLGGRSATGSIAGAATSTAAPALGGEGSSLWQLLPSSGVAGIGFDFGLGSTADIAGQLKMLQAEGYSRVIANPKIYTLDNQEATIFQGTEVPYETVSDEGTKVEFKEAGLKLSVRPTVVGDGNLLMEITVNKDTVDTSQDNPPISKSEIKTSLVSKDGSVVVIGGIYDENKIQSQDKVPLLGDVPVLGNLFKRNAKSDNRSELVVFIVPRIL